METTNKLIWRSIYWRRKTIAYWSILKRPSLNGAIVVAAYSSCQCDVIVVRVWQQCAVLWLASVAVGVGYYTTIPDSTGLAAISKVSNMCLFSYTDVIFGCCLFGWIILIDILSGNSAERFQEFSWNILPWIISVFNTALSKNRARITKQ